MKFRASRKDEIYVKSLNFMHRFVNNQSPKKKRKKEKHLISKVLLVINDHFPSSITSSKISNAVVI